MTEKSLLQPSTTEVLIAEVARLREALRRVVEVAGDEPEEDFFTSQNGFTTRLVVIRDIAKHALGG